MSDRAAEARAEAGRRFPGYGIDVADAYAHDFFLDGAEWADANPHSTPEDLVAAYEDGQRDAVEKGLDRTQAIKRAALGIQASHDRGDWDEERPEVQEEYLDMARAALAAALGEDEGNE